MVELVSATGGDHGNEMGSVRLTVGVFCSVRIGHRFSATRVGN